MQHGAAETENGTMTNSNALLARLVEVFGHPSDPASTDLGYNLLGFLSESADLSSISAQVIAWANGLDLDNITEYEHDFLAHLEKQLVVFDEILTEWEKWAEQQETTRFERTGAKADGDWESAEAVPGFTGLARKVTLTGGWSLYMPTGIGVPTLRHEDDEDCICLPIPAATSIVFWSELVAMPADGNGPSIWMQVGPGMTIRFYPMDDDGTVALQYENALWRPAPFLLSPQERSELEECLYQSVLWLSVYDAGPVSADDDFIAQAQEYVAARPQAELVTVEAERDDWNSLVDTCYGDEEQAARQFIQYTPA